MKSFKQWSDTFVFAFKKHHPDYRIDWKEKGMWGRGRDKNLLPC